jgi:diguanylate cyclase (GGDEF)-like protein
LLGRAWINARCAEHFESAKKFFVASLDLIEFRGFNHTKGYAVGAVILDGVDKLLNDNLKNGEWCFRIDGDRWYFLLSMTDQEATAKRIDFLRQTIAATKFDWAKKEFTVQVRGALTVAKGGDKLDRLEIALREAITAAKRQSLPLMLADGAVMTPLPCNDLGLAPVTLTL